MEELINTVNQLQEVFSVSGYKNVDLPQVVVVGTQSSGKSSVLEHLVGKSFLPRGSGIVTRCPLVLQLTQSNGDEYAIFQHDYGKMFTDYSLICQEIENQTERLAGGNKGICNTQIILKLFSPSFIDLTLVDLPGLTKVPVGDQPYDIDEQTKKLTLEYVNNPNSIILAVIPGNVDMATSESLKISRDVDPEGKRTLAVVTKLDIMDTGTNAIDMLSGKIIPVKLGIIGVVNRSQKDIEEGKSIKDSLKDEAEFFKKRYRAISSQHGTPYLTKAVQRVLINHIKSCLPELKDDVSQQLEKRRAELEAVDESKLDKSTLMLDFITKFTNNYCSTIRGNLQNVETNEICGGARIKYVFQNTLHNSLQSIDALTDLSKSAIIVAVQNASGASPALFAPQIAFELLVKRQIKKLRSPCLVCVDLVHVELNKISQSCLEDLELGLAKYPKLQREISVVVDKLVKTRIPLTNEMIQHYIEVQLSYINTSHPDFLPNNISSTDKENKNQSSFINSWRSKPEVELESEPEPEEESNNETSLSLDKDHMNYIMMKEWLEIYFSITNTSIQDTVPKMIMHFLVNYVMDHLHSQLVVGLYGREDKGVELLEESSEVIAERTRLKNVIKTLEHATNILNALNSPKSSGV